MITKRIIPVLLMREGYLVQSRGFKRYQKLGNAIDSVIRLSEWCSDELIYLDITEGEFYDLNRDDQRYKNMHEIKEIVKEVSKYAFMPVTFGGKIRTLEDINIRLSCGADKVAINSKIIEDHKFLYSAAKEFGSQSLVVSVDYKKVNGELFVFSYGGKKNTQIKLDEYIKIIENNGAGEILLNSIELDGTGKGFDVNTISKISNNTNVPLIAIGGAGDYNHFIDCLKIDNLSAVAAANFFQHIDQSVFFLKKKAYNEGINVRPPDLIEI